MKHLSKFMVRCSSM